MLKLNRHGIYLVVVILLVLVALGTKVFRYLTNDTCSCIIGQIDYVKVKKNRTGKYSTRGTYIDFVQQPTARCHNGSEEFTVAGPIVNGYRINDPVTVLYSPGNMGDAVFLTFSFFWLPYYPMWAVLWFVITIAIYSFISKGQFLIFRFQRADNEKFIELTQTEKDTALRNRLKLARQAMFRKPRR